MRKYLTIPAVLLTVGVLLTACGEKKPNVREQDENVTADQAIRYADSQPVPEFDWSQIRQNLIEIETAQATTTQTTTLFFNQGVAEPVGQCPSIGFPIPSTYQLTNPDNIEGGGEGGRVTVAQMEATGVFTAESTGTYVMCVSGDGEAYAVYWEGFVQTTSGAAEFTNGEIRLVGAPSFDFSEGE